MGKKYKLVPFDIEKAKNGAEVVTVNNLKVEILRYDINDDRPIIAVINSISGLQHVLCYNLNGKLKNDETEYDLRIREEVKCRSMTNRELSWWLRDCPNEHREWKYNNSNVISCFMFYLENETTEECSKDIVIRTNGGEWREPLIEIE